MSYKITEFVLNRPGLTPTEKAVAHSLAYRAHEDGSESYPGIQTIAREAGLKDLRFTQRIIRRLEQKGVISATTPKSGGRNESGRGLTTHYRFLLNNPGQLTTLPEPKTPVSCTENPGLLTAVNPGLLSQEPRSIDPPNCPELSFERSERGKGAGKPSLSENMKCGGQAKSPENGKRPEIAREFFVWLRTSYRRLHLSEKRHVIVSQTVLESQASLRVLKYAVDNILDGTDWANSYERSQAASNLALELPTGIEAVTRKLAEKDATAEFIARRTAELQEKAQRDRAERRAQQPEEEIEETLGECELHEPVLQETAVATHRVQPPA